MKDKNLILKVKQEKNVVIIKVEEKEDKNYVEKTYDNLVHN